MIELEHNGERYMVDGGQWYRLLDAGERRPKIYQFWSVNRMEWMTGNGHGLRVRREYLDAGENYRVPCTDPRPPFVVGQRVKVARKDPDYMSTDRFLGDEARVLSIWEDGDIELDIGEYSETAPPWCLDAVEPTFGEKIVDRMEQKQKEQA